MNTITHRPATDKVGAVEPSGCQERSPCAAWQRHAAVLARWADLYLVNRRDVYGGYRPLWERDRKVTHPDGTVVCLGKSTTRPAPSRRGREQLTEQILARHFAGRCPGHLVGLHTTSPDNTSRWAAVEVDWHGEDSTAPSINWAAARHWYERLCRGGFSPLLTDSNGAGGYHLLVLFAEPVPTPRAFAFLRGLTADHAAVGLPNQPETFPKQPQLLPGRYGNWLRVFGRHHTEDHWSKAWDGTAWLDGEAAVEHILQLTGDSPALIPDDLPAVVPPPAPVRTYGRPAVAVAAPGTLAARIAAYMARLPNLSLGQGRDCLAYRFAAFLVRDLQLADEDALQWLSRWDQSNSPPKGVDRLREILKSAHTYGTRPYGFGRAPRDTMPARRRQGHQHTIISFTVEGEV